MGYQQELQSDLLNKEPQSDFVKERRKKEEREGRREGKRKKKKNYILRYLQLYIDNWFHAVTKSIKTAKSSGKMLTQPRKTLYSLVSLVIMIEVLLCNIKTLPDTWNPALFPNNTKQKIREEPPLPLIWRLED